MGILYLSGCSMTKNDEVQSLLRVVCKLGQLMLENGAETYRVEQTINIVSKSYNYTQCESSVIPSTISVSITSSNGETFTMIKRIRSRTVNLNKISLVNDLSRKIVTEKISISELNKQLDKIDQSPQYSKLSSTFFTALASASFCLLFGGNYKDFFVTFVLGNLLSLCTSYLNSMDVNGFFVNIVAGFLTSFLGMIAVNIGLGSQHDKIVIGSIMLLLPGIAITNAIRDIIAGDLVSGMSRSIEAMLAAISIALGTGIGFNIGIRLLGGL
ncbi:Uncharacterized membrane protein YjjP, DUF1212 family [Hathewaya proteolytica DSM 3090]|uniref:Uncharacterized membrane protein YjjP, DUF1212 family n=2 Tax=Hathewaya proteolytica TaxID=29365 RepID=A0A1M6P7D7_9CLOT|nr:Uncharacterized membrane protein YjjP, DUF1212 family [Hathewaya proteolytica DSM 3090]